MTSMYRPILRTDRPTNRRPMTERPCILENFGHNVLGNGSSDLHFMFGSRVGFSRLADRMALLPVGANSKWRPAAILENVECPYFCNGSRNSLRVLFYGRFSVLGSNGPTSIGPNPRSRSSAVLYNCKWPYQSLKQFIRSNSYLVLG